MHIDFPAVKARPVLTNFAPQESARKAGKVFLSELAGQLELNQRLAYRDGELLKEAQALKGNCSDMIIKYKEKYYYVHIITARNGMSKQTVYSLTYDSNEFKLGEEIAMHLDNMALLNKLSKHEKPIASHQRLFADGKFIEKNR